MKAELKALLDLVLGLVKAGDSIAKNPADYANDLSQFVGIVPLVQPALVNIKQVPADLSELSASDAEELVAYVASNLLLSDKHAAEVVDAALKVAVNAYELVKVIQKKA